MKSIGCLCGSEQAKRRIVLKSDCPRTGESCCNCEREVRASHGVAVTLAVLEAKRFVLLVLEVIVDWRVIEFAGGARSIVLVFLGSIIGLTSALGSLHFIRKQHRMRTSRSNIEKILKRLSVTLLSCVVLNAAALALVGFDVSIGSKAQVKLLNSTMRLYSSSAEWRRKLDLLQFDFQCCGSLSYVDWFLFDWQNSDYGPRDETETQDRISDEEYRARAVPFSCCNLKTMVPCVHYQMTDSDLIGINTKGCATPLGNTIFRKVFVGSAMTALLIMTQVFLTFLLAKIASWSEGPFFYEAVEYTARHLPNPNIPGRSSSYIGSGTSASRYTVSGASSSPSRRTWKGHRDEGSSQSSRSRTKARRMRRRDFSESSLSSRDTSSGMETSRRYHPIKKKSNFHARRHKRARRKGVHSSIPELAED